MLFSFINIFLLGLILLIYNIKIFLIFFVGTVLYILWILIFIKKNSFWEHKRVQKNSEEREKIIQLINGIKDIKLNNSLVKRTSQWKFIQNQLFHISSKKLYFIQIQNNGALFINEFKNIIILFITANLVIKGSMTLGMMLSVQYIIGYLNRPIRDIITFVQSWDETNIRIERMDEILKESDEGEDTTIDKIPKDKSIIFNNVSFGYGGKDSIKVIKNINLIIPENKTTAIVGTSGSGKTTLINLILKFYEVTDGEILIGNTDLNKIDTSLWRLQCGAVLQDSLIFTDTIANNISESEQAEIIDKDQLMKASRLANLDEDLIERLPSGYDSVVGSGGIKLSGGQIQRLLIARAIYKDPNYLFFDEATSSLDANNEKIIVENMNQVFNKKKVVVVAHRLSTVKNADKIVVLHSGEIVEEGTHEELVLQKKFYYNLVKNQLELGK
jgi:ATP-binding cassette subfamily B protein